MYYYFPTPKIPKGWQLIRIGVVAHPRKNLNGYLIKRMGRYKLLIGDGNPIAITRREAKRLIF